MKMASPYNTMNFLVFCCACVKFLLLSFSWDFLRFSLFSLIFRGFSVIFHDFL